MKRLRIRRKLAALAAASVGAAALLLSSTHADPSGPSAEALTIVQNGVAEAVVTVAADTYGEAQAAANVLVDYIERSTGARLPVETAGAPGSGGTGGDVRIYIGYAEPAVQPSIDSKLAGLDDDGFLIEPVGDAIVIIGPTARGTRYGVYAFLENYVGVRWLMPGPDGEDVPEQADLIVPREAVREEPAFLSRQMSPIHTGGAYPQQYAWAERNRLAGRVEFHHNLLKLFPPSRYGKTHPEFYPLRNGQPYIPANDTAYDWQPCFTAPGTVGEAVNTIVQYFNAHPEATSYSLGINDSGNFCEADPNHPDYPNRTNSLGLPDMSDIYYNWVNQVAEGVLQVHPGKWFGLLAYREVQDPPSFPLNPQVVPFVTKDRMAWIDAGVRQQDRDHLDAWGTRASNLAWYDYFYGTPYVLPRVYPHVMADNLRYAADHGVAAHYAELYPNWGEGPKPWVAAKLQWDPYQDVDDLLEEWYVRAVGPLAAPDLAAYYDHWEQFWTVRIQNTDWFDDKKDGIYMPFNLASYLSEIDPAEMAVSRALLESVVAKAQTPKQQARAELLLQAFAYYEAAALSYPRLVDAPLNDTEALALVDAFEQGLAWEAVRFGLLTAFQSDPVLVHPLDARRYGPEWSAANPHAFWLLHDYVRQHEPGGGVVSTRIADLASGAAPAKTKEFAELLLAAIAGAPTVNANSSFETGAATAPPWTTWRTMRGTMQRATELAHTGAASFKIVDLDRGGPLQKFDIEPGAIAARARYYTPVGAPSTGTIQLALHYRDSSDKKLGEWLGETIPLAPTAGQWASIAMVADVPEKIKNVDVAKVWFLLIVENGDPVYIDDAEVYQLP